MKRTGFLLLFLLSACSSEPKVKRVIDDASSSINLKKKCDCADLLDSAGVAYFKNERYTGICEAWVGKDSSWAYKYQEKRFWNGRLHGKSVVLDKDGTVLTEDFYVNGEVSSYNGMFCRCDDLIRKEASDDKVYFYLENNPYTGKCVSNYPHINQIMQIRFFQDGLLHGADSIFDQTGQLIMVTNYEKGTEVPG